MKTLILTTILLSICNSSYAKYITAICYEPSGNRADLINSVLEEGPDGYSNSNPTFFFNTDDPQFLLESWQAALPFPDLIDRQTVDELAPPTSTKSIVLLQNDQVIQAISSTGNETSMTTLYLNQEFGIFSRIRINGEAMGAIYTAKCTFTESE
tara:strand:+ start:462 stop:923 length:462 start_codon:yes stop_codon:yes gene_type:complete